MELISVTPANLDKEHICCAISNNNDCQVASKKAWLAHRFQEGLVFLKGDVRGKCFIEYIPSENAWSPVEAEGYIMIDCLWVSGQFKGQGFSNQLMDACIADSKKKGRKGLVALSSVKKLPFLADPKYLAYKGFLEADRADPYFVLYYLPFEPSADKPRFRECVKSPIVSGEGFVLYYANQCPYTAKYVPMIAQLAADRGAPFRAIRFETAAQAQAAPSPFTSYSLFYQGAFVTHEILSEPKFGKLLTEKGY